MKNQNLKEALVEGILDFLNKKNNPDYNKGKKLGAIHRSTGKRFLDDDELKKYSSMFVKGYKEITQDQYGSPLGDFLARMGYSRQR